jgi:hypothetical protein
MCNIVSVFFVFFVESLVNPFCSIFSGRVIPADLMFGCIAFFAHGLLMFKLDQSPCVNLLINYDDNVSLIQMIILPWPMWAAKCDCVAVADAKCRRMLAGGAVERN